MPVLVTHNLTKVYGTRHALDALSLVIPAGQIFGFLGPNGAGKTTTIKILLGFIRASSGSARFFDSDLPHDAPLMRHRIGALVETPCFFNYLTARRNLQLLSRIYGPVDAAEIDGILETVGLADRADETVRGYSLGMRQRLGVAQALLRKPELLILDEPTNGLDPQGIVDIRNLLQRLNREHGTTILISSHLLNEVEQLCSHIGFIHRGRLLKTGPTADFLQQESGKIRLVVSDPQLAYYKLQSLPGISKATLLQNHLHISMDTRQIGRMVQLLVQEGIEVSEVSRHHKTLEEAFLELSRDAGSAS